MSSPEKPPKALPFFPTQSVWSLALNNPLTQTPAYDAARGYFAIAGDRLVAYDLKSGTLVWTVAAAPTMPPAIGDDRIFFPTADAIVALQTADGSPSWRAPLEQPLAVAPVWDNGWLILAGANGSIAGLRATDGRVIWRHDMGAPPHGRPALSADRVYVPLANKHVAALRVDTGDPIWDRPIGGEPNEILAFDERIYVGAKDRYLYCIEADSGAIGWRSMRAGADVVGVAAYDDDRVYFVALDNILRAVSRRSGVQHWMRQLPLRPTSGPLRAGATIIVAGNAPALPTFSAKDGAPVGTLPSAPEPAAPPALVVDRESGHARILLVTADIAKGATVSLITRGLDPTPAPFAPLAGSLTTLPSASPGDRPGPRGQPQD